MTFSFSRDRARAQETSSLRCTRPRALLALLMIVLGGNACASRTFHSRPKETPNPTSQPRLFGSLFGGVAPFGLLAQNDASSREKLAADLEKTYADVLANAKSADVSEAAMATLVQSAVASLRSPGTLPCDASETLTLFRGHGIGALPATSDGKRWAPSDALYDTPPPLPALELVGSKAVAKGRSFEDDITASWLNKKISLRAQHDAFASAKAWNSANKKEFGESVDAKGFTAVSTRHSSGAWGSPLLSTSLEPSAAMVFRAPYLKIRVCPGRALPTMLTAYSSEKELLVFGFLLPEEIEFVHYPEASLLTRALMAHATGTQASIEAFDAASRESDEQMQAFAKAESGRTSTALEACLSKAFENSASNVAVGHLLKALEASPKAPTKGFVENMGSVCSSQ